MAEEKTTTSSPKVEGSATAFEVPPGLMSLDELDKIISESDPESLKNLETVKEIGSEIKNQNIEILQLDDDYFDGKSQKVEKLKAFKLKMAMFWVWLKSRFFEFLKGRIEAAKKQGEDLKAAQRAYRHWPTSSKLALNGAVVLFIATVIFAYYALVKKKFDVKHELFMTSLLSWSQETLDLEEISSTEGFYNSTRIPKNIFNLKRMVVNLRPSEGSGPNPMAAYEFSLEGNSTEVLIEIKDREGEIVDNVQRTIEEFTFDELNSIEGKKAIEEKVRSTINRLLTLGKIRNVYIVGVILKP